jgi:hypothetical protein
MEKYFDTPFAQKTTFNAMVVNFIFIIGKQNIFISRLYLFITD